MRKSRYLEVGRRVEYETKRYNPKTNTSEVVTQTGTILDMQTRQSIGYTSKKVLIKSDADGKTVSKFIGTPYGDKIRLLED